MNVGQESTLQGRFQALIFMVVNLVLQYHQHQGEPDAVLINQAFQIKAVGEIKTWWIDAHQLGQSLPETAWLRRILAQPVDYMLEHQCKYGFITTYEESIFLRQVKYSDGTWGIEHSPLDSGFDLARVSTSGEAVLSTRQCFYHFSCAAEQNGDVNNPTPRKDWIKEL
ncbi:uncharacterized protein N7477_006382 [Penicillium maclennaniae]|uniref:uncharacterized protein n=1 Tax=Penicillium maclennaniae TaxID=1343394 RepID=UPI002540C4DC|nr:uncharacterized protein N7477_006382 [Penicillium maclennaniae]KAJ5667812.1 hypothetical protein N7477_006382 [Penicillium maclennaniae]